MRLVPTMCRAMYIDGAYRHPTFLYEFIWNLLVFAFPFGLGDEKLSKRRRFLKLCRPYSVGRLFIEGIAD